MLSYFQTVEEQWYSYYNCTVLDMLCSFSFHSFTKNLQFHTCNIWYCWLPAALKNTFVS